ncbi:hypothetical protein JQX13_11250 [Archangium violaceum]|uniref:hypothetical protein n=1 Tax=Archangium violaceum TaxID=83451 RepID=UPI00193B6B87|nr:hypothetical protein [Archangium violaceum]QRK10605.1 hypothetical protein JQX13_11250 [Archangium violaceum]
MSHDNGIAARGRIRITENPTFPAHDFFEPGREFACRLRHASVSYPDDTVIQVRAASLKFADSDYESPLDLEMNTGTISLFWSARNFIEFVTKKNPRVNGLDYVEYYKDNPRGLLASAEGVRKDPSTFTQLYYHSQVPLRFVGKDGVLRYAKYRLIPENRGPETGLMPPNATQTLWDEDLTDPSRSPNYLKEELADRLSRGPVTYHLQIQLHTPRPGESAEILNSNVAWDEATHPHMDLGTVTLEEVLPFEDSVRMRFSMSHHPPSLGLLPAESVDDYNSLNYMRRASNVAKRFRLLFCQLLGERKPLPSERPVVAQPQRG